MKNVSEIMRMLARNVGERAKELLDTVDNSPDGGGVSEMLTATLVLGGLEEALEATANQLDQPAPEIGPDGGYWGQPPVYPATQQASTSRTSDKVTR